LSGRYTEGPHRVPEQVRTETTVQMVTYKPIYLFVRLILDVKEFYHYSLVNTIH